MDLYTVLRWWHTSHAPLQQLSSTQFVQHVLFSGHSPPPVSFPPLSFSLQPSSLVPSPLTPSLKNPRYFPPLLCILYSSSNWIFITPIPFRHTTERYTIKRNDNVLTLLSLLCANTTYYAVRFQNKRQFFNLLNYFKRSISCPDVWNYLSYFFTDMARISPSTFLISPLPASAVIEANLWFTFTRPSRCPLSHCTPFPSPLSSVPPRWPASLNSRPVLALGSFCLCPTDLLISHFDRQYKKWFPFRTINMFYSQKKSL